MQHGELRIHVTNPRSDPIAVRRGNRERGDAFQECAGNNHLLGKKDANELAVLFSEATGLLAAVELSEFAQCAIDPVDSFRVAARRDVLFR